MTSKLQPLYADPVMQQLVTKYQIKEYWGGRGDYFLDLVEIITGQQLSIKAAKSIFDRFLALFPEVPTPIAFLALPAEKLRAIGFSTPKAKYVKNLAEAISSGDLLLNQFEKMVDEEIKKELIKIKGIGPWSAEMFLIFSLKRPDVFSVGDLGLRTAIERLYGIKRDNLKKIEKLSQSWRPHRTLASRLLWASLEKV